MATSPASNQIIDVLHLRRQLVNQRTQTYNRLQALAHSGGLPKGKMKTLGFQSLLKAVPMNESGQMQREHLFSLLGQLTKQIRELQSWLNRKASSDKQVQLLLTQRGVGYLTALATVNTADEFDRRGVAVGNARFLTRSEVTVG